MSTATLNPLLRNRARPQLRDISKLVGIRYLRASKDSSGREISVASQDDEGEEFFDENGITHLRTYTDNNLSGSHFGKDRRDDYERALDDLKSGRAHLLWTFDSSRAQRDLEMYVQLRKICIQTGAYWAYGGRIYDMTDPVDRKITARDAAEAEGAADNISIHSRRGVRQRAKRGDYFGHPAYGYRPTYCPETGEPLGWVIVEEESATILRMVEWVKERKNLRWIANTLNDEGVPCPHEGRWDRRKVLKLAATYENDLEWHRFTKSLTEKQHKCALAVVMRVHAGEAPKEIGRDLNRRGISYVVASRWDGTKVRNVVKSKPRAGMRVHLGKVVKHKVMDPTAPEGFRMEPVPVTWKEIISPDDHVKVLAILEDPARATHREGTRAKHLWTGIARCGVCDGRLESRNSAKGRRLGCMDRGCVSRRQDLVEAWLTEQAIQLLEREDAAQLFRLDQPVDTAAEALDEAERLRAKLDGFRDDVLADRITRESFAMFEAALLPEIKKADERAKRAALPPVLSKVIGPDARGVFLGLDIAQQREILRAIMRPRMNRAKTRPRNGLETETIDSGFLFTSDASDESVPAA
ncbi:recombinase family protein [Lentzea aerocolonigenes]|uniref:recombinase family protein n=1 Tax=Lentzea aerocolonigenes TaxID=68170 RepID=UPI0009E40EC8|nr:recombinase family protein [Lentzea aerocolonigenes]